jgi:hypothetical protein
VPHERADQTEVRVLEATLRWLEHSKGSTLGQPDSDLEMVGVDGDPQKLKN